MGIRPALLSALIFYLIFLTMGEEDNYIDPFDMLGDTNTKSESSTPPTIKVDSTTANQVHITSTSPTNTVDDKKIRARQEDTLSRILMKKYVETLLGYLDGRYPSGHSQEYSMMIKLTKDDIHLLQRFVIENKGSLHDIQETLSSMVMSITESHLGTFGKVSLWFEDRFGTSIDAALKMLLIMICASVFAALEMKLKMSWRQRLMKLIVLSFIISIPMTWYELYKAAEIQQQTVTMKDVPAECVKEGAQEESIFVAAASVISSIFTLKKDNCQRYYEHMLIDPILKVTPTKALSVTFVRFFVSPLKDVGTSLSEFIRALLIDLPLSLYPIAIALVSVFVFMLLFMWFGYSVRLPFFLSIEAPTAIQYASVVGDTPEVNNAIEQNTQKMLEQMQAIQEDMRNRDDFMLEKIKDLEKLQKFALEHTVTTPTDDESAPTLPPAILPSRSITTVGPGRNEQSVLDNSLESSISIGEGDVKSPIPCSDFSESETTEEKTAVVPESSDDRSPASEASEQRVERSPARNSKLPVSMLRSKSKDKESPTEKRRIVQDRGDSSQGVPSADTLASSAGQRGSTFYKMKKSSVIFEWCPIDLYATRESIL